MAARAAARAAKEARNKRENAAIRWQFSAGGIDSSGLGSTGRNGNTVTAQISWVEEKSMDLNDVLDEVNAPEECVSFVTMTLLAAEGMEEEEIDKAVVVVRFIVKKYFARLFEELPCYHSHEVDFNPDQKPFVVRLTIFLKGSDHEIREAWGLAVPLSSVLLAFQMRIAIAPGAKGLLEKRRRETVVLDRELRIRASGELKFKKLVAHQLLGYLVQALKNFYPFVGKKADASMNLRAPPDIPLALLTGVTDINEVEQFAHKEALDQIEYHGASEPEVNSLQGGPSATAIHETAGGTTIGQFGGGGVTDSRSAAADDEDEDKEPNCEDEVHGGRGTASWLRRLCERLRSGLQSMEKLDLDIALPALSMLLPPVGPDFVRGLLGRHMIRKLTHLLVGAGGLYDTIRRIWDGAFGAQFKWSRMRDILQEIEQLLQDGEASDDELMVKRIHHCFSQQLVGITSVRIQCENRGLTIELDNLRTDCFVPGGFRQRKGKPGKAGEPAKPGKKRRASAKV